MCNFIKQDYIITFIKSIQLKCIVIFYGKVYYSLQNTVFKRVRCYFVTFTGLGVNLLWMQMKRAVHELTQSTFRFLKQSALFVLICKVLLIKYFFKTLLNGQDEFSSYTHLY
jgi:hypothetical protein